MLELDKVMMEVLFLVVGVVKEIKVKVGDNFFEGKVVVLIEVVEGEVEVKLVVVVVVVVLVVVEIVIKVELVVVLV